MPDASVLILYNPVAGGGRAGRAARRLESALGAAGREVISAATGTASEIPLPEELAAIVVVGGDGAVRLAASTAIRRRAPLYHVPYGTANLFAHEFGMSRETAPLLEALERGAVRWVDAAAANGHRFVLMVSVGFDADVVHDVTGHRGDSITYRNYLSAMLRQLRCWRPAGFSVSVDGRDLELDGPGMVVVANCRQYMWGMNPAADARMDDGLLDVVFLPIATRRELAGWLVRCIRGRHTADPRLIRRTGTAVEIRCPEARRFQLDGDPPPEQLDVAVPAVRIEIEAGVLPVLVPPRDTHLDR